jgi:hypothetical protein
MGRISLSQQGVVLFKRPVVEEGQVEAWRVHIIENSEYEVLTVHYSNLLRMPYICRGENSVCCTEYPSKKRKVIILPVIKYIIESNEVKGGVVGAIALNFMNYYERIDLVVNNLDEVDIGVIYRQYDTELKVLENTVIEKIDKKVIEQIKQYSGEVLKKLYCLDLTEEKLRHILQLEFNQTYIQSLGNIGGERGEEGNGIQF